MVNIIEFYSLERVDVGIGVSKDVEIVYVVDYTESPKSKITLEGHPKSGAVRVELLNSSTVRVTNNSMNVVSLWPGKTFLTVTKGHPIYEAMADVVDARLGVPMKEATFTGTVTDIRTETDLVVLELGYRTNIKLQDAGYHTVEQLDKTHGEELLSINGIGESTVCRIREAVSAYMEGDNDDGL